MAPSHFVPSKLFNSLFESNKNTPKTHPKPSPAYDSKSEFGKRNNSNHSFPRSLSKKDNQKAYFEFGTMTVAENISKSRNRTGRPDSRGKVGTNQMSGNGWDSKLSEIQGRFEIPNGFAAVVITIEKPISVQLGLSLIASEDPRLQGYFHVRKLLDAGACKQDGRIIVGDVVAMVNGHHLKQWQQLDVINMLRRPLEKISMVLLREKTSKSQNNHFNPTNNMYRSRSVDLEPTMSQQPLTFENASNFPQSFLTNSTPNILSVIDLKSPDNKQATEKPFKYHSTPSLPDFVILEDRQIDLESEALKSASNENLLSKSHLFSDEDSEDEHDHESVVASLLNKYNPRRPFTPSQAKDPIVYLGRNDKKTEAKLAKAMAPHSKAPIYDNRETEKPSKENERPLTPKLALSDSCSSDTNLSRFNINGQETPAESIADFLRTTPRVANAHVLEPRFIPEPNQAIPFEPAQKQIAVQTNSMPEPKRKIYSPGHFQDLNSKYTRPQATNSNNGFNAKTETSFTPTMRKIDSLSDELDRIIREQELPVKKSRPNSASERKRNILQLTPPISPPDWNNSKCPGSSFDLSDNNEGASSLSDRIVNEDFPNLVARTRPKQFASSPSINGKTPPLLFQSPVTDRSGSAENPATFTNYDFSSYNTLNRPKSRRNMKEEDLRLETPDEFLKRVKQISDEFNVDPSRPIEENLDRKRAKLPPKKDPEESPTSLSERPHPKIEDSEILSFLDDSRLNLDDFSLDDDEKHWDSRNDLKQLHSSQHNNETPLEVSIPETRKDHEPGVDVGHDLKFATEMVQHLEPEEVTEFNDAIPVTSIAGCSEQSNMISDYSKGANDTTDLSPTNECAYSRDKENISPGRSSIASNRTYDALPTPQRSDFEGRFSYAIVNQPLDAINSPSENSSGEEDSESDLEVFKESLKPSPRKEVFVHADSDDEVQSTPTPPPKRKSTYTIPPESIPKFSEPVHNPPPNNPAFSQQADEPRSPYTTDRKISPIDELEEHENPEVQTKVAQRTPLASPPVRDEVPDSNKDAVVLVDRQGQPKSQKKVHQSKQSPSSSSIAGKGSKTNTNTSTLESADSRNSFTIVLDESERDGEVSYASTPTILKDALVDDLKAFERFKPKSQIPAKLEKKTPVKFKSEIPVNLDNNTPVKLDKHTYSIENCKPNTSQLAGNPTSKVPKLPEYEFKRPPTVNLISYDDWKNKFSQEVNPTDKIRKPTKIRSNSKTAPTKRKTPSLRDRKRSSDKRIGGNEESVILVHRTGNSRPKSLGNHERKYQAPIEKLQSTPVQNTTPERPLDHDKRNKTMSVTAKTPQRSHSTEVKSVVSPKPPNRQVNLQLSASKYDDQPCSHQRRSSQDDKMGFNVALNNFKGRKSSPSPKREGPSPKVTPRNSINRQNAPKDPPNDTAPKTPETSKNSQPVGEKSVSIMPTKGVRLKQSDFIAKRNFFELSAKLKSAPELSKNPNKSPSKLKDNPANSIPTNLPTWI